MAPEKIGRYEIKNEIGRGGMATVYEAYDPRFERTVALKMLPREFMHEAEFRARFTREARTIATLEHPAIVPVYDFGEEDGQPFLVMRLMTGGSLSDRLADGPIPIDEAAVILKRLGSALDRAHSKGIIHRDLKPSNVLFDQYGDAFLADFGIVHVSSSTNALTASGSLVGTPTYMSPEQVYGDKQLDGRSDIYALGVILFQMLTGNTPFDADTPARMMMKHVMDPVPQILSVRPDLPPACNDIINKAMAKERDERFSSATDLSSALTAVTKPNLQQPNIARLEEELSEMQADLLEEMPTETQARKTAVPPEPATRTAEAPPPPPPVSTDSGPVSFPTHSAQTQTGGGGVPKWIWGIVALVVIVCLAGVGLLVNSIAKGDLALFGEDPTSTPRPDEDEEEEPVEDQATEEAIAALETEEAEVIPTDTAEPPTAVPTNTQPPPPTTDALATRQSVEATRAASEGSETAVPPPPPPPPNGSGEPIAYGGIASGQVDAANPVDAFSFTGEAGDIVPMFIFSFGEFDAVVDVVDSRGNSMLPRERDTNFNVENVIFELPADGEYTVHVYGFEGSEGRFDLQMGNPLTNIVYAASDILNEADVGEGHSFPFIVLQEGEMVGIFVEPSEDLDVALQAWQDDELLSDVGINLERGFDYAIGREEFVMIVEESGNYSFKILNSQDDFAGNIGEYEVTLFGTAEVAFELAYGDVVNAQTNSFGLVDYVIGGSTGDNLVLNVMPEDDSADFVIEIMDLDDNVLASIDDGLSGEPERLNYTFATDDLVIIRVREFFGSVGEFVMTVDSQ
ncbi:MAG: serine/threonine protein kinase [Anaerolineales bacterium]|nr:serine/threonine protein kinase [Anaerolineales bacterium]